MNTTQTETRFWFFGNGGRMIVGNIALPSFAAARDIGRQMNRDGAHATLGYVQVIADASTVAHGRVTTVDGGVQRQMF